MQTYIELSNIAKSYSIEFVKIYKHHNHVLHMTKDIFTLKLCKHNNDDINIINLKSNLLSEAKCYW